MMATEQQRIVDALGLDDRYDPFTGKPFYVAEANLPERIEMALAGVATVYCPDPDGPCATCKGESLLAGIAALERYVEKS